MTTATQPGIEPRTTRFPGDCCGGHFFFPQSSLSSFYFQKKLFCTHPECSLNIYIYIYIYIYNDEKSTKGKSTRRDSNLRHRFAWQIEITHTIHHAVAPSSKKDGSMTDFKHTQSDPHGSHRKMLHVFLTHLPPRCALTFFPTPQRATSQTVESSSLQGAQTRSK